MFINFTLEYQQKKGYYCTNVRGVFNNLGDAKVECSRRRDCSMLYASSAEDERFIICAQPSTRVASKDSILYIKVGDAPLGMQRGSSDKQGTWLTIDISELDIS